MALIEKIAAKFATEIGDTGLWWVIIGAAGQLAFTGRFLYQWIVSEKKKKSVVPIGFWYLSIIGALILLTYFIRRGDVIGTIGQSVGFIVYIRNLMLIYKEKKTISKAPA